MLCVCISFITASSFSQKTIADAAELTAYNDALNLYNTKAYFAAQKSFKNIYENGFINSNLKANASYYEALCAVLLQQPKADKKLLSFIKNNPHSSKKNTAYFKLANYYFKNKKAANALKWFQKVSIEELSVESQKEFNFKMGISFLVTKEFNLAKERFLPLINDAKYGNDSKYYYGFIAYKLEDYGASISILNEIPKNTSYSTEISYYLLDISFKEGKFERCIEMGLELHPTISEKFKSDVSKIIGESYFNLKEYAASINYLKAYKGKKNKWTNTDFYQLGYAYYKQNNFENAVRNFNKIIVEKNTVSQNAYYHLGECYLKLDQKSAALNAFKSATEMSFNKNLQQDAALNYAKLSYEKGNPFQPVVTVLQDYLKAYPTSKAYAEINALIVSSFLNQQDYKGALAFLAKKTSKENTTFSREISLYRGLQLFNDNKYKEALPLFIVGKRSKTLELHQKARYWEAETIYRLENYTTALTKFKNLKNLYKQLNTAEFNLIDYNIGYCHFKLKQYKKASDSFEKFLKKQALSENLKHDALIRLGDSYFATTNYRKAILIYKKVTIKNSSEADYADYQIAMSHGFTNENEEKIIALKKVINAIPISNLKDDALYQLGNTYSKLKDNKNAHFAYNKLETEHPKSAFLSRSLLRQGLLYFNDNQAVASLKKYKNVTSKFPNSPDALEAVANARKVYIQEGNLEDYVIWIATLKFINSTNSELENTTFAIAEKKYLEAKQNITIVESLEKYIKEFPEGLHIIKANYYMADVLFKGEQFQEAAPYYLFIINKEQSEYTEAALNKLSQIYLNQNNFKEALPLLDRLEKEAYIFENILFAQSNLMKGYYETTNYKLAIGYAKKIIQKSKIDNSLKNDAKKIIARSSIKTSDFITAKEYYSALEKTTNKKLKAEALYYNAYFKNQQKEYEASNKVIQELISKYTAYKYWAVKSYVIMGKNYYALEDVYQATFVLENVIKNFKEFDDIIKEAEQALKNIKVNEAKPNNLGTLEKTN